MMKPVTYNFDLSSLNSLCTKGHIQDLQQVPDMPLLRECRKSNDGQIEWEHYDGESRYKSFKNTYDTGTSVKRFNCPRKMLGFRCLLTTFDMLPCVCRFLEDHSGYGLFHPEYWNTVKESYVLSVNSKEINETVIQACEEICREMPFYFTIFPQMSFRHPDWNLIVFELALTYNRDFYKSHNLATYFSRKQGRTKWSSNTLLWRRCNERKITEDI